jgi:cyclopropane fatty-acyl-phospholipid synthase-like methyltransferase
VLEIGCGPGAVARAVAEQLTTGHILAIDRSSAAIDQLKARSKDQIASGRLSARRVAVEDFALADDEEPFDLVFAIRVGALDGRHPEAGKAAIARIAAATHPHARLLIDGGQPLRELPIRNLT